MKKFTELIKEQIIPEWKEFYINYRHLFNILSPLRSNFKSEVKFAISKNTRFMSRSKVLPQSLSLQSDHKEPLLPIEEVDEGDDAASQELFEMTKKKFFNQLRIEAEKFQFFFDEIYNHRHNNRFDEIVEQLNFVKQNKEYKIFNNQLEKAFKAFYKDIYKFQDFISTNIQIKQKIVSKYIKYTSSIEEFNDVDNALLFINDILNTAENLNKTLMNECEKKFSFFFHQKYNMHPIKVLKDFLQNKTFTSSQSFFLGIVIGLMLLLLFSCFVMGHNHSVDFDSDIEFRAMFPIYRTFGILCLYLWTLGLNVWAWNNANINYKALFFFDNQYSDVITICKRNAFFTILLFVSLLIYMIIRSNIPMFMFLNQNVDIGMLPLICWAILLAYFFCPLKIFNYSGRVYTMRLFVESVASIFIPTEFRHIWFMDQLTSLIGPMRDIEYTMCYYSYYVDPLQVRQAFCSNNRGIYLCIAIFPNFIRCLQCARVIIDSGHVFPQIFNIGKYSFNIIVATFSFLTIFYPNCFKYWLIFACISGCYSSFWDVKMDFGFFEEGPNFPLRNKLTYKNHFFYHFTIVVDIILRFLWVLSVSPEIMNQMIRPEFLALMLFTLEMFRRGLWNFIRVEYEHLDMMKKFQISYYEELPFIKSHGQFIINEDNLINIINLEKEDKIKLELRQIFTEVKKVKTSQGLGVVEFSSEKLEKYLEEYKQRTLNNTGSYIRNLSK